MKTLLLAFLLSFAATAAPAAAGFEVAIDNQPVPERAREIKGAKPLAASTATERIRLDVDTVVVESSERRLILDFRARRKYHVDARAGTYVDHSLYADAGFKSYEILNRELLAKAMAAALPDKVVNAVPLAEHELAIAHPRQPGRVQRSQSARSEFLIGNLPVFSFGQGTSLDADGAVALGRYFRYTRGGHPTALASLVQQRVAPAEVAMLSGPFQAMRTTLRFRPIAADAMPSASLAGLRKVASGGHRSLPDDVALAAFRIGEASRAEIQARIDERAGAAEKLLAEGKVMPGFLAVMEVLLAGADPQPLMTKYREAVSRTPEMREVLAAFNNSPDKEGSRRAIAALNAARPHAGDGAYVLGIFQANHHLALGEVRIATERFVEALRRNPTIAGAWKDLGDTLFRQYEAQAAWVCWDAGRKVAPGFANFQSINEFEKRLRETYPEYF